MFREGDLSLLRSVSADGNLFSPRIQTSATPRETEVQGLLRLAFGAPIPAPAPLSNRVMNGQLVDLNTMLMCSGTCGQWKPDDAFRVDARNARSRRGRSYWCRACLSRSMMYARPDLDDAPAPKRGRKKRK
jgi:hypothetical protein